MILPLQLHTTTRSRASYRILQPSTFCWLTLSITPGRVISQENWHEYPPRILSDLIRQHEEIGRREPGYFFSVDPLWSQRRHGSSSHGVFPFREGKDGCFLA
jgi:hypothetical protein